MGQSVRLVLTVATYWSSRFTKFIFARFLWGSSQPHHKSWSSSQEQACPESDNCTGHGSLLEKPLLSCIWNKDRLEESPYLVPAGLKNDLDFNRKFLWAKWMGNSIIFSFRFSVCKKFIWMSSWCPLLWAGKSKLKSGVPELDWFGRFTHFIGPLTGGLVHPWKDSLKKIKMTQQS